MLPLNMIRYTHSPATLLAALRYPPAQKRALASGSKMIRQTESTQNDSRFSTLTLHDKALGRVNCF
jgi:hypothetical protein